MNILWLLLIPYCTLAFGIHGGEGITGINRQVRNALCAAPFAIVAFSYTHELAAPSIAFTLAYVGANMGFTKYPLWLKGLVTLPPFGAALLPLAYWIGDRTPWKNVTSEYLSGFLYGLSLYIITRV